jgi:thymidylate kinase
MRQCRRLTIFEGPDGSGKSTAAQAYAEATRAKYVHFPALPQVDKSLGRIYVEAMLPALLGYQDVVFDRCWISELPYGISFRDGADRLGTSSCRMLDRLAMRCGAVVVMCLPEWETVKTNWSNRRGKEMLNTVDQLRMVYDQYTARLSTLPEVRYNYVKTVSNIYMYETISALRPRCHQIDVRSAGSTSAQTVLVGDCFESVKEYDSFYQWPFASFSNQGCSQWLTTELDNHDVTEQELFWVNADQNLEVLYELNPTTVIALGAKAAEELYKLKINAITVPHPQHQKRFRPNEPYELFNYLEVELFSHLGE